MTTQILPNALYVINHSGGKDSQAMYLLLKSLVRAGKLRQEQILVIHAHLAGVEWEGTLEHIKATVTEEVIVIQAKKTFLGMVENRGMWPSAKYRQCTSDLKRDPIKSYVIKYAAQNGFATVVNCMGLRAGESCNRAKMEPWKVVTKNCTKSRTWYEWLPIHGWSTEEVFAYIAANGQSAHWAYAKGMPRLSCCFCIMAGKEELGIAARLNPELYAQYVALEKKINHSFVQPKKVKGLIKVEFLEEVTGVKVEDVLPAASAA